MIKKMCMMNMRCEYEMLRDAFGPEALEVENNISKDPNEQTTKFLDNLNNVGEPIYPGNIKYTQLKFINFEITTLVES